MPMEKEMEQKSPTLLRSCGPTSSVVSVKLGKPAACRNPVRNLEKKRTQLRSSTAEGTSPQIVQSLMEDVKRDKRDYDVNVAV